MLLIPKSWSLDPPPPGCFCKRGCKPLKTKDGSSQEKAKRRQAHVNKRVDIFDGPNVLVGNGGAYAPVATGSMRKLLRRGEILAPRDAHDGGSCVVRVVASESRGLGRVDRVDRVDEDRACGVWAGTGATMEKGSAALTWK